MTDDNAPATLAEIGQGLQRVMERLRGGDELMRGVASFIERFTIRVKKVEDDQRNLNTALSERVGLLEQRLREIEMRLHIEKAGNK